MTLTDAGPLIALASRRDADHARCVTAAHSLPAGPLVSTWPCFTEAMHGDEGRTRLEGLPKAEIRMSKE